ncbi:hypothetical protein [Arabiibacter massiliensis]|uniref:hypothetical protein n=1 Tax=Arabiibacter massiliensis TaxID=1870985 RepID=UPI0009BB0330|nr:hypothetical protein [Arabiibacter massiliensis]
MDDETTIEDEDFLEALRGALLGGAQAEDDEEGEMDFATVVEANQAVAGPRGTLRGGAYARAVADWLLEHGEASGTADQWHNFITHFLNADDYLYALKLARKALEAAPYNIDLLGDVLQSAGKCGEWELGERVVETAKSIPRRYWDWYLAIWASEFYVSYADVCRPEERSEALGRGLEIIRECRMQSPLEERLYNQEAEILIADNRIDEARDVLESAIYQEHEANDGTACMIPAAQCCLTYLDTILYGVNDYAKIMEIARRGIKNAAGEKEKVNTGYFLLREALALDGSIHEEEERNHARGFGNQELVRQTLDTYDLAYRLNERNASYRKIIRERYAILCGKSGIADRRLPEDD